MPESLFLNYLRHNEINEYLDTLATSHPELITVSECGKSYEGRPIKSVKISYKNINPDVRGDTSLDNGRRLRASSLKTPKAKTSGKAQKNTKTKCAKIKSTVLIDGGIHGREWMSVATAVYCIHELVEHFERNRRLLEMLDFIIVPIVNVDGYEYSHTNLKLYTPPTQFPLWRKTRRPLSINNWIGTDCNRNFDHHWRANSGSSCRNTYPGKAPFSEPETNILKMLMHSAMPDCKFYLSLHSHAKAFMYPWGYTKKPPNNWRKLHELALIGRNAIAKKTGSIYRCGSVATLNHRVAAGGSPDYAFGIVKIPYAMAMELSGGSFHPPSTDILKIAQESWIGIRAMCTFIAQM